MVPLVPLMAPKWNPKSSKPFPTGIRNKNKGSFPLFFKNFVSSTQYIACSMKNPFHSMENENKTNNCKRKETSTSQSAMVDTNTINDFHDDILTHIISFLPIKDAFRTTVLSKRWLPLCHLLSDFDIDDKVVKKEEDLIQFRHMLDAVLFSPRSQDRTLKSFKLKCCSSLWDAKADCFSIDKWVEAAKRRRIEYLNLYLFENPLAPTIFCCRTLVVLSLADIHVADMFDCSVHLPLLKTLHLISVRFQDRVDFMKLLSGCPKLEYLITILVKPSVSTIEENGGVPAKGCIKTLSKLVGASICLFEVPLRALYNVQALQVIGMGKIIDNEEINSYCKGFPMFENLTDLRLCWTQYIHNWEEVMEMLQYCPKLQALKIGKSTDSSTKADWKYPCHVPECVTSRLTTCRIENYEAFEADFRFATYILLNARLLQVMTIFRTLDLKPMGSPHFSEDLASCPTISPTCKLEVI